MTDEPDENDGDENGGDGGGGGERSPTGRKKRSDAGRPRGPGGGSGRKHVSTRFERRAKRVEETIRELVKLGKPDLDVEGLSFSEVVNRDVSAWGRFFAQLAEWLPPFGAAIDLVFGSPLVTVLNMLPSFRAARRDLRVRREQRQAELEAAYEAEEQRAAEEPQPAPRGVFEPPLGVAPAEPETRTMTREEWLANGGGAGT